jgi:betaine-homocysteine S-methyltransferase
MASDGRRRSADQRAGDTKRKKTTADRKGVLQRLAEGPVISDGSFCFLLERRGYVKSGYWTPEAVVENPDAVTALHKEFARAGADVTQAFTFYASEDKLAAQGNNAAADFGVDKINAEACRLAWEIADQYGTLVAAGLSPTPSYKEGKGKEAVQREFRAQTDVFSKCDVDFMIVEFFCSLEEMLWAIEVCKGMGKPIAASMCIGPEGDSDGNTPGECAVAMTKAGAEVVGVNCLFDPTISLNTIGMMKDALQIANLKPYLMCQPIAYHTPDVDHRGLSEMPEYPFALEPRLLTRWDMHKFAREAYEMGVMYLGGCCGMESYHIRAIAEEVISCIQNIKCHAWYSIPPDTLHHQL